MSTNQGSLTMSNLTAQNLGLKNVGAVRHNLSYDELFELETSNAEGAVSANGTMMVDLQARAH